MSPKVQIIAMPLPFSGSASVCALHRHAHAEERRHHLLAEQRLVALVVGMRDQRDAGGNQLGAGRFDLDRVGTAEDACVRRCANLMRW